MPFAVIFEGYYIKWNKVGNYQGYWVGSQARETMFKNTEFQLEEISSKDLCYTVWWLQLITVCYIIESCREQILNVLTSQKYMHKKHAYAVIHC